AAAAGAALAGAEPAAPTTPSTWPGVTVAPSGAAMSLSTPSAGAETSRETLSVSSSTRTSSFFTGSPGFLVQRATVASETDSPRLGVRISGIGAAPASSLGSSGGRLGGEGLVEEGVQFFQVAAHQAR